MEQIVQYINRAGDKEDGVLFNDIVDQRIHPRKVLSVLSQHYKGGDFVRLIDLTLLFQRWNDFVREHGKGKEISENLEEIKESILALPNRFQYTKCELVAGYLTALRYGSGVDMVKCFNITKNRVSKGKYFINSNCVHLPKL